MAEYASAVLVVVLDAVFVVVVDVPSEGDAHYVDNLAVGDLVGDPLVVVDTVGCREGNERQYMRMAGRCSGWQRKYSCFGTVAILGKEKPK